MSTLERDSIYHPGARFFEEGGEVMFQFQADASSKIGPRKATRLDRENFRGEWEAFNMGRLPQLDHDGDGRPGGAAPADPPRKGRPPKPKE